MTKWHGWVALWTTAIALMPVAAVMGVVGILLGIDRLMYASLAVLMCSGLCWTGLALWMDNAKKHLPQRPVSKKESLDPDYIEYLEQKNQTKAIEPSVVEPSPATLREWWANKHPGIPYPGDYEYREHLQKMERRKQ